VQAEQTRDAEASRRVAEDRLRIARDLHDTVAHQISVISLHAGVAAKAIDDDPDAAKAALAIVRGASRRVLGEIGNLVGVLRSADDAQHFAPPPGLERLAALITDFQSSGLHVDVSVDGDLNDLPASVDLVGYWVVQEALTNAHKHGSAPAADVRITRSPSQLHVVVTNPAAAQPSRSTSQPGRSTAGHGLLGVRERVDAVGGDVFAGHNGAVFRIEAVLPLRTIDVEGAA
jgi:signal transduction histidine kinase